MLAAQWQMDDDAGQIEALAAVAWRCSALADPEAPQQMPLLQPPAPVPQPPLLPPLPAVPAAQMPPAALPGHRLVERRSVIDTGHWPIEVRPRAHRVQGRCARSVVRVFWCLLLVLQLLLILRHPLLKPG